MGTMQTLGAGDPPRIGPYMLTARLGAGGMGSVYLGWDAAGRPAAVKVVRHDFLQDPDFRARFRREISSARRVSGPWISQVLDADPDAESPWLATEYVAGPTLDAAVSRFGPLPTETVAVLAECLGQALRAVHEAGVVHRDIKPNNILLAADGPRLIDFGIARATDDTKLTATHAGVFGVPGFIAPERIERSVLLPAGDVFAGGAVLTFAATGKLAFGGGEPVTVAYRVVHSEPDLDGLPEELRPLVAACLSKDPAMRPDASQLAAAAALLRGASDWPGVPTVPDWSDVSATADTYQLASTWLPEPLARHTVRDYDLTAGFAAAETARLNVANDPRAADPRAADPRRADAPFLTPLPTPPQMSSPYGVEDGRGGDGSGSRATSRTKLLATSRKKAVAIGGGVAVLLAVVAGAAMMSSKGTAHGGTALQGSVSNGQTPAPGGASGKEGADLTGATGGPPSGGSVPDSTSAPAAGNNAPSAGAPSSTAPGANSTVPHSPTSAGAPRPSTSAPQGATGAPPAGGPSSPKPPPASSPAAPPPPPTPVPCSGTVSTSSGTGYNCPFDTPGNGTSGGSQVLKGDGSSAGYLHQGTNWVLCEAQGRTQHQGQYFNNWWAWTQSDNGSWGWVNAVSAAGGDNNGAFGGVPACNGAHGAPPQ